MKKPRFIYFERLLKGINGHYLNAVQFMVEAAFVNGYQPIVIGHESVDVKLENTEIVPAFKDSCLIDPICYGDHALDVFLGNVTSYENTVRDVFEKYNINSDDMVLDYCTVFREWTAISNIVREYKDRMPRTVVNPIFNLKEQLEYEKLSFDAGLNLWNESVKNYIKSPARDRLMFFSEGKNIADEYACNTGLTFDVFPLPVDPKIKNLVKKTVSDPINLVYLGSARIEKGFHLIPHVAQALKDELKHNRIKMILQCYFDHHNGDPGMQEAKEKLSKYPNIVLIDRPMEQEEYRHYLANTDLMLLPYRRERYFGRGSKVLLESAQAGIPMIVSQQTWLSEQLEKFGAGIAYDPSEPKGFSEAVIQGVNHIEFLKEKALKNRQACIELHNPQAVFEHMTCPVRDRFPVGNRCNV